MSINRYCPSLPGSINGYCPSPPRSISGYCPSPPQSMNGCYPSPPKSIIRYCPSPPRSIIRYCPSPPKGMNGYCPSPPRSINTVPLHPWVQMDTANFGGILSLVLGLGTLAVRPEECCWNYLKTFEFRKRLLSEYKTYNRYRNDLERDQCLENTSWVF